MSNNYESNHQTINADPTTKNNNRIQKISKNFYQKSNHFFPLLAKFNFVTSAQIHSIRNYSNESNPFNEQEALWREYAEYLKKNKQQQQQPTTTTTTPSQTTLTHLDENTSLPKQVDLSGKSLATTRIACASGCIQLDEATFSALIENKLKKGNALIVAQLAGIQASKQTALLIPLCHQLSLDVCQVEFVVDRTKLEIRCQTVCKTVDRTGVEMEALTACSVALLTIYDMCKAMQKSATINNIRLEYKTGGKSDFKRIE